MKKTIRLSILLLLACARLPAQALPADSLFDRLVGHWTLRGTIARQPTIHDVTFDWMLGREYVQMHEVSRETTRASGWTTPRAPHSILRAPAGELSPATRFTSCSTTRKQTVSTRPLSTVASQTRGSGTWIMTALEFAGRLPG